MLRWCALCVLMAGGVYAAVWLVASPLTSGVQGGDNRPTDGKPDQPRARDQGGAEPLPFKGVRKDEAAVIVIADLGDGAGRIPPVVIHDARLSTSVVREVPSEREGRLTLIGTEIKPGEVVPPDKKAVARVGYLTIEVDTKDLAFEVDPGTPVPPELLVTHLRAPGRQFCRLREKDPVPPNRTLVYAGAPHEPLLTFAGAPGKRYRRWKETDPLTPGKILVAHEEREFRKLQLGNQIEKGQLLGLINPAVAIDEVAKGVANLEATEADRAATEKLRDEALSRYKRQEELWRAKATSFEEYQGARLTYEKYVLDQVAKAAGIIKTQRELAGAVTLLSMHEIRAGNDGTVKAIYKQENESVRNLDSVLQLQNTAKLQVEGLVEVQDSMALSKGMVAVVEPTRPVPPSVALRGHLQEVNCVAVSKGKVVVSGSEDGTLRGWDTVRRTERWGVINGSPVRAVACTPVKAERDLVLYGLADGSARLVDLSSLKADEKPVDLRDDEGNTHNGAVLCVAFSPDGKSCATGGEDRAVCLWDTATGKLLDRFEAVHKSSVTSLAFAGTDRLVTAGRGDSLCAWPVEEGKIGREASIEFNRRSGDVAQLGVSPDGKHVLVDQGKEVRVLSLKDKRLEGVLQNPGSLNFSTFALFAPNGETILTVAGSEGKPQLWRTPTGQGRGAELRQFIWTNGASTCGTFAPDGTFAVTGTRDGRVLIWAMPSREEVKTQLTGTITLVEGFLDSTTSKQVKVWAELDNPGWLIPGGTATMVIQPDQQPR